MYKSKSVGNYLPISYITKDRESDNGIYWFASKHTNGIEYVTHESLMNIYRELIKDPDKVPFVYHPSKLEVGDLILFGDDEITPVGYAKLDGLIGVKL